MDKGWRLNVALVERRERLAKERVERQIQRIKLEISIRQHQEETNRAIRRLKEPAYKIIT